MNLLDEAAKEYNIWYSKFPDTVHRHIANKILQTKAWKRVISKDALLGEYTAALLTTSAMAAKRTLGIGLAGSNKRKRECKRGKGLGGENLQQKEGKGLHLVVY